MLFIWRSRHWAMRVFRISLLSIMGWWLLQSSGVLAPADRSQDEEWPRTNFNLRLVELEEITSGGPPKDGIPAIDRPRFVSNNEARKWLKLREPVIALRIGSQARAYPLQILMYHEIVNDVFDGVPVSATFCPLCNASIVFDRRVGTRVFDFGTSGKLRNSDLVMYDRQTESWWQQFTGQAIVGEMTGTTLTQLPSQIIAFEDFQTAYPQGQVLSRNTGYQRPYGENPYEGYDSIDNSPFLYRGKLDGRLPPMERVLSVAHEGAQRIYPFTTIRQAQVINDELNGVAVVVISRDGLYSALDKKEISGSRKILAAAAFDRRLSGQVLDFMLEGGRLLDRQTGSEWSITGTAINGPLAGQQLKQVDSGVHFAFAWLAFNPETDIYREQD